MIKAKEDAATEKITEIFISVKNNSRPNHLWIHLQKRWPERTFVATVEILNADGLSLRMKKDLKILRAYGCGAYCTLPVLNMHDIKHIFRAVKRGNIRNPILFTPYPLQ